jgi:cell division protein FtsA
MTGSSLEAKVHVALANSSNAKNLVSCINKNDLEVMDIVFAPIASSYGVLSENDKELGIIVIDIGHGTSTAVAYLNGSIVFSTVLPVGGYNITNDLAISLNIDTQTAEKIKLKYGYVEVTEEDKENFLDLEKYDDIDMYIVSNIISERVLEIFEILKKELEESGTYDKIHSGVVLTGGTANLNGIQTLAKEVFDKNIKIGFPHHNIRGLTDLIKQPEYATLVGLLHFAKEYHYLDVQKNKKRKKKVEGSGFFKKFKDTVTKMF